MLLNTKQCSKLVIDHYHVIIFVTYIVCGEYIFYLNIGIKSNNTFVFCTAAINTKKQVFFSFDWCLVFNWKSNEQPCILHCCFCLCVCTFRKFGTFSQPQRSWVDGGRHTKILQHSQRSYFFNINVKHNKQCHSFFKMTLW